MKRTAEEHIGIVHGHRQSVVRAIERGLSGEGKSEERVTSLIVSTIKFKKTYFINKTFVPPNKIMKIRAAFGFIDFFS